MHYELRDSMVSSLAHSKSGYAEDQLFYLLDFLTFNPTPDEICRAVVMDFLAHHSVGKVRLALLAPDDSLHHLGQYGFKTFYAGMIETTEQWRSDKRENSTVNLTFDENFMGINAKRDLLLCGLRENGVTKGSMVIVFKNPMEDLTGLVREITMISRLLSFYLLPRFREVTTTHASKFKLRDVTRGDFTARQLQIMQGMIDEKTNHELATTLGYSVSTVRHETMRIFQILGVSDRAEAARAAIERSII